MPFSGYGGSWKCYPDRYEYGIPCESLSYSCVLKTDGDLLAVDRSSRGGEGSSVCDSGELVDIGECNINDGGGIVRCGNNSLRNSLVRECARTRYSGDCHSLDRDHSGRYP